MAVQTMRLVHSSNLCVMFLCCLTEVQSGSCFPLEAYGMSGQVSFLQHITEVLNLHLLMKCEHTLVGILS